MESSWNAAHSISSFFTSGFLIFALCTDFFFLRLELERSAQPRRKISLHRNTHTPHHSPEPIRSIHTVLITHTALLIVLLSPVLAQPAMEGVEVRWRPAVGSSLAPLSLCSWLLCASGVFVTVSLSVVLCLIPKFHVSEVVPLKLAYDAPMDL